MLSPELNRASVSEPCYIRSSSMRDWLKVTQKSNSYTSRLSPDEFGAKPRANTYCGVVTLPPVKRLRATSVDPRGTSLGMVKRISPQLAVKFRLAF